MSASAKHTVRALFAAIFMAALSSFFAITLVRLLRHHHIENGDHAAASEAVADVGAAGPES
jgi:hypothetical protein